MNTKLLHIILSCAFFQLQSFSQQKIEDYTSRHDDLISIEYSKKWTERLGRTKVKVSKNHLKIVLEHWEKVQETVKKSEANGYDAFVFNFSEDNATIEIDAWRLRGLVDLCSEKSKRNYLRKRLRGVEKIEDYTSRHDDLTDVEFKNRKYVKISKKHLNIILNQWESALKKVESSNAYGYEKIIFETEDEETTEMDAWRFRGLMEICRDTSERRKLKKQLEKSENRDKIQEKQSDHFKEFQEKQIEKRRERRKRSEKRSKESEEEWDENWNVKTKKNSKGDFEEEEVNDEEHIDEKVIEDKDEEYEKDGEQGNISFVEEQKQKREKKLKQGEKRTKDIEKEWDEEWEGLTENTNNMPIEDDEIENPESSYNSHLYYRFNRDLIIIKVDPIYVENTNILTSADENQLKVSKKHLKVILSDCSYAKNELEENEGKDSGSSFIYKPSYWKHRPFEIDYGRLYAIVKTYCSDNYKRKELLQKIK